MTASGSWAWGLAQALGLVGTCEVTLDWEVTGWSSYLVIFNPNRSGPRSGVGEGT